jgi:hypothetical protein
MRLSLTSMLSTLVWAAAGISVVAVGLGRSAPRTPPSRSAAVPRYHGYNGRFFSSTEAHPRFLDRDTGQFIHVDLPAKDSLEYASCSPWRDERGQYHVVSRWMNRAGEGSDLVLLEFGLAHYTLPEGRMIERVALDLMPVGEPCWFPGQSPRVLFAAGDGRLYRYSLEESDGGSPGGAQEPEQPRCLNWRTIPPGLGMLYIKDLIWPTDPKLGGRLIASLSYQMHVEGKVRFLGSQLWWLALSDDGLAIEQAGRLTVPEHDDIEHALAEEERLPSITTTPEGGLALAYLTRTREQAQWELRLAPIESNPATGAPTVRCRNSRDVSRECIPAPPTFSTDGRWVYGMLGNENNPGLVGTIAARFPVADALATLDPGRPGRRASFLRAGSRPRLGLVGLDRSDFTPTRLVDERPGRHARR